MPIFEIGSLKTSITSCYPQRAVEGGAVAEGTAAHHFGKEVSVADVTAELRVRLGGGKMSVDSNDSIAVCGNQTTELTTDEASSTSDKYHSTSLLS